MIGCERNKRSCNRDVQEPGGTVVSKDLRGDIEAESERIRRSQPCRDGRTFQAKGTACIKTRKTCHFKYLKAGI